MPLLPAVIFYAITAVTAWAWLRWIRPGLSAELWGPGDWPADMGAGAAAGLGIAALSAAAGRSFRWARGLEDEFRAILGDSKGWEIAVLAFISGMAEEYLFRGALQENFGIWIAAAVFAVLHWPVSRAFFPWPIAAGAIGLALGGLRLWTNSLVAPAAAHGVINLINLWRLTRRGD